MTKLAQDVSMSHTQVPPRREINSVRKWLFVVGLAMSTVSMVAFFCAGFLLFFRSIVTFYHQFSNPAPTVATGSPLVQALEGLEYLFLAPLTYIVFLILTTYASSVAARNVAQLDGITLANDPVPLAEKQLHDAKSLIMGLMIAVIATDLLSKVLDANRVSVPGIATEVVVMAVFVGYFFVLRVFLRKG